MESKLIFFPMLVQVVLTFLVYIRLTMVKHHALEKGNVNLERRSLHHDAWPDSVLKVSNNLQNQFESPVLLYVLCFVLWALNKVTLFSLVVVWGIVSLRALHVLVHTGSNVVEVRKKLFMSSTILLVVLCGCAVTGLLVEY